jgi:hypothetical protein
MRPISTSVVVSGCLGMMLGCLASPEDPSPSGSAGTTGTAGTGTTGAAGTIAAAGTNGSSGNAGTTGAAGTNATGVSGTTGAAGTGTTGGAGTTGAAGTTGGGGRAGRGGATGAAGVTGIAGTSGGGAGATGAAGSGSGNCTITPTASLSTKIKTVGIVTFTTTAASPTEAHIDFGLTTSYGLTAPVDLTAADYRTLLLGMKQSKMYHYRITVTGSGGSCVGGDNTLMTGALINGLNKPTITTNNATALSGGFLITGQYQPATVGAYILDVDGDYVWQYSIGSDVTGARMSYDGKYMWINSANVPSGSARVRRVTMDGMTENNYDSQFTGLNHQLAILPDETVAFYAYGSNGCDDVKERSPSGTVKTIANSKTALKINDSMCHLNNIQYSKSDDTLVFSNLQSSQIAKLKRSDGSMVWILNGSTTTLTGASWVGGEHGIHIIDPTHLLIFNNNSVTNGVSQAIELQINESAKTAMKVWTYTPSGTALKNMVMGDVQRLANGNTIIGFSTMGVIHEVSSTGTLLQSMSFAAGVTFGYIEKRPTLYGPPPR